MTNCTMLNATLHHLPLTAGHWRQNPRSQFVRACPYADACLGGTAVNDASCAPGHRGLLCDICEPLYHGGRGGECTLCSESGDSALTLGLAVGLPLVLLLASIIACVRLRRTAATVAAQAATTDSKRLSGPKRAVTSRRLLKAAQASAQEGASARLSKLAIIAPLARRLTRLSSIAVKLRILISLCQIVSQVGETFEIAYPPFYTDMLAFLSLVTIPFDLLPFGCVLPSLDTYLFDYVVATSAPLAVAGLLWLVSVGLKRTHADGMGSGKVSTADIVAEVCSELWFFTLFLMYPGCVQWRPSRSGPFASLALGLSHALTWRVAAVPRARPS